MFSEERKSYLAFDAPEAEALRVQAEEALVKAGISFNLNQEPAHITVKGRLLLPTADERTRFLGIVREMIALKKVRPVSARLASIGHFVGDQKNIHLRVIGPEFTEMWRAFIKELSDHGYARWGYEGWTPHITLADKIEFEKWEEARTIIYGLMKGVYSEIHIDTLVLYEKEIGVPNWVEGERIKL